MPLPGGSTDKFGNRYEGLWTVKHLLEILNERADNIRLEPPDVDGAEFWLEKNDKREYHQVKRQIGAEGRWQLSTLNDKKVIDNFGKILSLDPINVCVFVSGHAAYQLDELSDRARRSVDFNEFSANFLTSQDLKSSFGNLCKYWNCSNDLAYLVLTRVFVRTVDEETLRGDIEQIAFSLVDGSPATVIDVLAEYALKMVHHTLTAHDIWNHLDIEHGLKRRQWNNDPHILAAIQNANESYLSPLQSLKIADRVIPRQETGIILEKINSKANVMVIGEAGVGKSGVMLQVVESLKTSGIPFLAFGVDTLSPTPNPKGVGKELGFSESPTTVLAAVTQGRKCVLLIDQLDAVSQTSGRNPDFFNCIEQIIKQTKAHAEMSLVIACRKFDLDNDRRFKQLIGDKGIVTPVIINRLSHQTIQDFLSGLNLQTATLTPKQLDLLSIPLHLSLLVAVMETSNANTFTFQTAKDLFDQFWDEKQKKIRERINNPVQWTRVIDAMCDYISDHQENGLSAPERVVDDYFTDAKLMASEHILVWGNHQISFFHQAFFDYAFARRFASRGKTLINFLSEREQHLSLRTQVRQILLYERDGERNLYLKELQEVLTSSTVRFHLKQLILSLLATLDNPTEDEWNIIAPLIINPEFYQHIFGILRSSISWFKLMDSLGLIEEWLKSIDESRIRSTLFLMSIHQIQLSDRIAELAKPYLNVSDVWNQRLTVLIGFADLSVGRKFFELFLNLVVTGIYENDSTNMNKGRGFWSLLFDLPKKSPRWACEAVGKYFNSYLSDIEKEPQSVDRYELFPYRQGRWDILDRCANGDPAAYVENMLPLMLKIMDFATVDKSASLLTDWVWRIRNYGGGHTVTDDILTSMVVALSALAKDSPNSFQHIAKSLSSSKFETVQYLLIRAYSANGSAFADEAIDYLCSNPQRLKTGYSICSGNANAAPYWATRLLIQEITPHCSPDRLTHLEDILLDYFVQCAASVQHLWYGKFPQFVLLDAIASTRISNKALRRLQELRRKYEYMGLATKNDDGKIIIDPPEAITAGFVGSPIPQKAEEKMTDEQWLEAIKKYDSSSMWNHLERGEGLTGGAHQLSQNLENEVKKQPERFARLLMRFPNNSNSAYFDGVLLGLAATEMEVDVRILSLTIHHCHNLPDKPCGRSICWLVSKRPNLSWNISILNIIEYYAISDLDPEIEFWRSEGSGDEISQESDILNAGINTTRGSAVRAIAKLIFSDSDRTAIFINSLPLIVRDTSIAVRACAAETLIAVINYDRNLAVILFQQLCDTEVILLGTRYVERFLYYTLQTHFHDLNPILERSMTSILPSVSNIGATQACIVSLAIEDGHELANSCLSGTPSQRKAAAEVFGANFRFAEFREFCEKALIQLFNDPQPEVRKLASHCFFHLEKEQIKECTTLIEAFVESSAFVEGHDALIRALEKSKAKLPDITISLCERFIDVVGTRASDIRTSSVLDAKTITNLLLQTYSQSSNAQLNAQCLDLIDRLSQMETYGLSEALALYETSGNFDNFENLEDIASMQDFEIVPNILPLEEKS